MKVFIEEELVVQCRIDSLDDFIDEYRHYEVSHGRTVPRYSWEAMSLLLAGWLLNKIADALFSLVIERIKKSVSKSNEEIASQHLLERHRELIEAIENISLTNKESDRNERLFQILSNKKVNIIISLETDSENELRSSLIEQLDSWGINYTVNLSTKQN